jgi:hypothetical protein
MHSNETSREPEEKGKEQVGLSGIGSTPLAPNKTHGNDREKQKDCPIQ